VNPYPLLNYSPSLQKGGLDNYLKSTPSELLGYTGMQLRMRVRAKQLETRDLRQKGLKLINPSISQPLTATPLSEYQPKQVDENGKLSLFTPSGIQALREFVGKNLGKEKPATYVSFLLSTLLLLNYNCSAGETIQYLKQSNRATNTTHVALYNPAKL